MNTVTEPITRQQIVDMLNSVIVNVDDIYKKTHTKTEYLTYKIGKSTSRFFKFMRSPQVKVINLVLFWAVFVASWIITAVASGLHLLHLVQLSLSIPILLLQQYPLLSKILSLTTTQEC
jgi:hypothetical protein